MYVAILTYKKPLADVDRYLQAHRDFLACHYAAGDLLASGPRVPRIGGVIMLKSSTREAVDAILAEDPFQINGIAEYNVIEFTPTLFCDESLRNLLK